MKNASQNRVFPKIVVCLVLFSLAVAWYFGPSFKNRGAVVPVVEPFSDDELEAVLREYTSDYQRRNRELLEEFTRKLQSVGREDFAAARRNIRPFVAKVTTVKFCSKMCWRMVADKLQGTATASELLGPELTAYILAPCSRGQGKIQDELANFLLKLQENDNQYRAGLAELAGPEAFQVELQASQKVFRADLESLMEKLGGTAIETGGVVLGTGLEILFIRSTLMTIAKPIGPMVARLTGAMTVGGVAAVADGPLPVGDIIWAGLATGSLAWTAYDLHKVAKVLPRELTAEVTRMIDNSEQSLRNEALAQARAVVKRCAQSSERLVSQLK